MTESGTPSGSRLPESSPLLMMAAVLATTLWIVTALPVLGVCVWVLVETGGDIGELGTIGLLLGAFMLAVPAVLLPTWSLALFGRGPSRRAWLITGGAYVAVAGVVSVYVIAA